jgi:acyl-CoA thioester hydrolase
MARAEFNFFYRFRVRFSEVDPQSVVFNSRYLEYADVVLTEFWRWHNVDGLWSHLRHVTVDFFKPFSSDEEVDGFVRVESIGVTSYTAAIELHGKAVEDLRTKLVLVYVNVDRITGRPMRIADSVRNAFELAD